MFFFIMWVIVSLVVVFFLFGSSYVLVIEVLMIKVISDVFFVFIFEFFYG